MKKHFLKIISLAVISLLTPFTVNAKIVHESEARMIALKFMNHPYTRNTIVEPQLVDVNGDVDAIYTEPTYYIYNYGVNNGFIIVSGDDCMPAVLAFSEKGSFVADGSMPPQVDSWLKGYDTVIQDVRAGRYSTPLPPPALDEEIIIDVQPLIKSQWNQDAPYNELCPALIGAERAATGCTATAIAQIMKYHNWPDCGEGSNKHLGQTVDFSQSIYDWEHMRDIYVEGDYTDIEAQAVAKLMSDVGHAVWMQYSDASAAQNAHIYRALYTHFKYSRKARYILRNTMTTNEWKQLMRAELKASRPVYYAALSEDQSMGHAFVCDGIDLTGNYLHFNWGWSGNCDGFYYLHTLNPPNPGIGGGKGNFNADHTAIIGIEPAGENEEGMDEPVLALLESFRTLTTETSLGKNFETRVARVWNFGPGRSFRYLVAGLFKEGKFVRTVSEAIPVQIDEFTGSSEFVLQVTIPEGTPSGEYELRLITSLDGVTNWEELPVYHNAWCRYIALTIESNRIVIQPQTESGITFSVVPKDVMPVRLMPRSKYQTKFGIENTSEKNFNGTMCWRIKKLISPLGTPPYFLPQKADTVIVVQTEWNESLYSGELINRFIDYSLDETGNYLLEFCYIDPLSKKFKTINTWPLKVEEPLARYGQTSMVEWATSNTSDKEKLQTWAQNKTNIVVVAVDDFWKDSIDWVTGKDILVNRSHGTTIEALDETCNMLQERSSVADMQIDASFTDESRKNISLTVHTKFAYTADMVDMRLSVLALQLEDNFWHISACYPAESFKGQYRSIPSTVEAGQCYTYEFNLGKQVSEEVLFMAVLTDATTGETVNVALVARESLIGKVSPQAIKLEHEDAVMSTGMQIPLTIYSFPLWATTDWTWSSSHPEVATVDANGIVNTMTEGVTEIRVSSVSDPQVFASMTVNVIKMDAAQELQVNAGCLNYLVSPLNCPATLVLSGELDTTDIALLHKLSQGKEGKLRTLDISHCQFVWGSVITDGLFKDCSNLKTLVLPENTLSIGDNAFMGCSNLQTITIPATVQAIGYAAFAGCENLRFYAVAEGNTSFKSIDGVLYNYAGTELVAYPIGNQNKYYTAVETLNTIRPFAFYQASHLQSFTGNLRLSAIGYAAFYQCNSLQSIELANRMSRMDEYAFAGCTSLLRVVCRKNNPPTCAADNVFADIPLEFVRAYVPEDYIEDYRLSLGWRLFAHYADVADGVEVDFPDENCHTWLKSDGRGRVCVVSETVNLPVTVYASDGTVVSKAWTSVGETQLFLYRPGLYLVNMQGLQAKVIVR